MKISREGSGEPAVVTLIQLVHPCLPHVATPQCDGDRSGMGWYIMYITLKYQCSTPNPSFGFFLHLRQ